MNGSNLKLEGRKPRLDVLLVLMIRAIFLLSSCAADCDSAIVRILKGISENITRKIPIQGADIICKLLMMYKR